MPFDIGSLFGGGNLNAQQARVLAGQAPNPAPNPNPQVAPGGSPSPQDAQGAAPGGGQPNVAAAAPGQTPSQTYAPDPQNGQLTNQMLLRAYQHDQFMNSLSYDLRRVGASFGTAQQQASSMAALGSPPQEDTLGALGKIQEIQKAQQDLSDKARWRAGADLLGQQVFGLKPGQGSMMDPETFHEMAASHFRASEPTPAIKEWNQARAALKANGHSDAEIDQLLPPEMLTLGPTADIGQRQYTQEMIAARHRGDVNFPDYETWKAQHATTAKVQTDIQMDRQNATQSLPDVNRQLNDVEGKVDEILNDPALPSIIGKITPSTGALSLVTATPEQRNLAQKIKNLMSTDYAQGFKIGGASRKTQFELGQLSAALNGSIGNTNLSEADYRNGLLELKNKFRTTHANAYGEAGDFSNMDKSLQGYLDPEYRQGGKLSTSGAPGGLAKPSEEDKKDFAAIAAKYGRQAAITHFRENNVDPTGL